MDHLPQKNAEHILVPLVARRKTYTPGDFFRLPGLYGFSGAQLAQKGPDLLPREDRPASLQEWLFFALIAQVLDKDIDIANEGMLRRARNGEAVVDTSRIWLPV